MNSKRSTLQKGHALLCAVVLLAVSGCATTDQDKDAPVAVDPETAAVVKSSAAPYSQALAETVDRKKTGADDPERSKTFKGSGIMVKGQSPGGAVPPLPGQPAARAGGNVVLNFEAADLREVIRNILGDILGEAYLIDPTVNGQVTIRTTAGVSRDALYATLETLLRMNNATMIKEGEVFKILPAALGAKGSVTPQLGSSQRPLPKGYSVQIVPLRYVSAKEMVKILEPFAKDAQAMRADELRNLMVLSGTELELRHLIDTIEMFDIDWMAGMSVGIFTLKNTNVKDLAQDIQGALGENMAMLSGVLKFIPVERMNAIMVVSPQQAYLDQVKTWIEKFDEMGLGGDTPRFYVYPLRYARADRLAPLLQQALTGKMTTQPTRTQPTLAPGTSGVTMGSSLPGLSSGRTTGTGSSSMFGTRQQTTAQARTPAGTAASGAAGGTAASRAQQQARAVGGVFTGGAAGSSSGGMGIVQDMQVVADEDNNAILIVATPAEYALAEQAIKKLDVPQRQVVIEVTMAEVNLTDTGNIGSKWWFLGSDTSGGLGAPLGPTDSPFADSTFSLILTPGQFSSIIQATGKNDNVRVVANPHLAALDNQEASIDVTTPTPILTTSSTDVQLAQNYTYINPGIKVKVKPHINEGGNVSLEADIEFSAISGTLPSGGGAPQLLNRSVTSQLMVPSGSTMVIGGLIRDDNTFGGEGIPFLSKIPVLGMLFGTQSWNKQRTELVIFLTPRVVHNDETRRAIIRDLRYRMDNLEGLLQESKALPSDLLEREDILGKKEKKTALDESDKADDESEAAPVPPPATPKAAEKPSPAASPSAPATPQQPPPTVIVPAPPASSPPVPATPAAPAAAPSPPPASAAPPPAAPPAAPPPAGQGAR